MRRPRAQHDLKDLEGLHAQAAAVRKVMKAATSPPSRLGMTPEVIQIGLTVAVENIENFLRGKPTHVVVPPKG